MAGPGVSGADRAGLVARLHGQARADWAALTVALSDPGLVARVDRAGGAVLDCLADGHKVLVIGNGGSAAMASHVAAEFAGRCVRDRRPLPAMSLAESATALTAVANDYGFDEVFSRAVVAHGRTGDVLVAMTTSGRSPNVLAALDTARAAGLVTVVLTGRTGGRTLAGRADHVLAVPSDHTPRIQEVHLMWTHGWSEAVDEAWAGPA